MGMIAMSFCYFFQSGMIIQRTPLMTLKTRIACIVLKHSYRLKLSCLQWQTVKSVERESRPKFRLPRHNLILTKSEPLFLAA